MFKLSIATSYTDPESRMDPWKEALSCYEDLADEVVRSGENWPYEFTWDYIGKVFNESYKKASGDWVIRMDLDYFFHEKDFSYKKLNLFLNSIKQLKDIRNVSRRQKIFLDKDFH